MEYVGDDALLPIELEHLTPTLKVPEKKSN